jgi:hypothetical protein
MSFEQLFDASMRVGLNHAEAEEQVKKAKDAGYLSDDPYLLPFIAEGLLLRAARLVLSPTLPFAMTAPWGLSTTKEPWIFSFWLGRFTGRNLQLDFAGWATRWFASKSTTRSQVSQRRSC